MVGQSVLSIHPFCREKRGVSSGNLNINRRYILNNINSASFLIQLYNKPVFQRRNFGIRTEKSGLTSQSVHSPLI